MLEGRRRSWSELTFASSRQHHALVAIIHIREKYFDSNMIKKGKSTLLQCFLKNSFSADVTISTCLRHQTCPFARTFDDVNYCSLITVTFSLGLMGKVVIEEYIFKWILFCRVWLDKGLSFYPLYS